MLFFSRNHSHQWFFNGFTIPGPSPLNVFLQINHWNRWFFDGFLKIRCDGQRWFWPWKRPKNVHNRDRSYWSVLTSLALSLNMWRLSLFWCWFMVIYTSWNVRFPTFAFKLISYKWTIVRLPVVDTAPAKTNIWVNIHLWKTCLIWAKAKTFSDHKYVQRRVNLYLFSNVILLRKSIVKTKAKPVQTEAGEPKCLQSFLGN